MKLFIICSNCNKRINLSLTAKTKQDLMKSIGGSKQVICPHCKCDNQFHAGHVTAEATEKLGLSGGSIGLLIGIIGGPIGMVAGGIGGLLIGYITGNKKEQAEVQRFNNK